MNSRGGPYFWGRKLMNSRGGPHLERGSAFSTIYMDLRVVQIMYCPLKLKNCWQAQNFLII